MAAGKLRPIFLMWMNVTLWDILPFLPMEGYSSLPQTCLVVMVVRIFMLPNSKMISGLSHKILVLQLIPPAMKCFLLSVIKEVCILHQMVMADLADLISSYPF